MPRVVLSTVGTSLLTNGASPEDRGWLNAIANPCSCQSALLRSRQRSG